MNGLTQNSKHYNIPDLIMPDQLPKVKMDLAGLSRYQRTTGKSLLEMSEKEKRRFLPKSDYSWLEKL